MDNLARASGRCKRAAHTRSHPVLRGNEREPFVQIASTVLPDAVEHVGGPVDDRGALDLREVNRNG
jgi:hypothetical protein